MAGVGDIHSFTIILRRADPTERRHEMAQALDCRIADHKPIMGLYMAEQLAAALGSSVI